jgi:fermentation-respiration switch protein FrsA (DUF1100 family)
MPDESSVHEPSPHEDAAPSTAPPRPRRRRCLRWTIRIIVVALLIGYPTLVGLDRLFYYPSDMIYDTPDQFGIGHEDVSFETADGLKLHGWWLPARHPDRAKGIVVHFHGNAANVSAHIALVEWLPRADYHVLMFDYRGYGKSTGRVTRAGTIVDGHAAVDYALSRPEAAALPLFAYGQSLGGAVAIVVAAERPELRAVVAESTFSGYRAIAAQHARRRFYFHWVGDAIGHACFSADHDPIDVVQQLAPRPLLVIAAERDDICFPALARDLYEAAGDPKEYWEVPGAEHLSVLERAPTELVDRVDALFTAAR